MDLHLHTGRSLKKPLLLSFAVSAVLVALAIALEVKGASLLAQIATFVATVPLLTLLFAMGSEKVSHYLTEQFQQPAAARKVTALMALCLAITGVGSGFDPYFWLLMAGMFAALLLGMRELQQSSFGWLDMLAWLAILIPFDYRLTSAEWFGVDNFAYAWWAAAVSVLTLLIWRQTRQLPGFNMRLKLRRQDLVVWVLTTVGAVVVLIPLGLWLGFIEWRAELSLNPLDLVATFLGLFTSVAIPEELLFRGVLMMAILQVTGSSLQAVLFSSLAFGIFHWNRVDTLDAQLSYTLLASIAGVAYALAYRKTDNNLLAPVLTHTSVDWIWKVFFITR